MSTMNFEIDPNAGRMFLYCVIAALLIFVITKIC
jgi:hypothetical protein